MKLVHDSKYQYIAHLLEMIDTYAASIQAVEETAKKFPALADACAEAIISEKEVLENFKKELEKAYALPNR